MLDQQGNYKKRIIDNNIRYFHDFKPWENNFAGKKNLHKQYL